MTTSKTITITEPKTKKIISNISHTKMPKSCIIHFDNNPIEKETIKESINIIDSVINEYITENDFLTIITENDIFEIIDCNIKFSVCNAVKILQNENINTSDFMNNDTLTLNFKKWIIAREEIKSSENFKNFRIGLN